MLNSRNVFINIVVMLLPLFRVTCCQEVGVLLTTNIITHILLNGTINFNFMRFLYDCTNHLIGMYANYPK